MKTDWARKKVEPYRYQVTIFQEPMAADDTIKLLRAERARARRVVREYRKVLDSHIDTRIKITKQDACDELLRRLR